MERDPSLSSHCFRFPLAHSYFGWVEPYFMSFPNVLVGWSWGVVWGWETLKQTQYWLINRVSYGLAGEANPSPSELWVSPQQFSKVIITKSVPSKSPHLQRVSSFSCSLQLPFCECRLSLTVIVRVKSCLFVKGWANLPRCDS